MQLHNKFWWGGGDGTHFLIGPLYTFKVNSWNTNIVGILLGYCIFKFMVQFLDAILVASCSEFSIWRRLPRIIYTVIGGPTCTTFVYPNPSPSMSFHSPSTSVLVIDSTFPYRSLPCHWLLHLVPHYCTWDWKMVINPSKTWWRGHTLAAMKTSTCSG